MAGSIKAVRCAREHSPLVLLAVFWYLRPWSGGSLRCHLLLVAPRTQVVEAAEIPKNQRLTRLWLIDVSFSYARSLRRVDTILAGRLHSERTSVSFMVSLAFTEALRRSWRCWRAGGLVFPYVGEVVDLFAICERGIFAA